MKYQCYNTCDLNKVGLKLRGSRNDQFIDVSLHTTYIHTCATRKVHRLPTPWRNVRGLPSAPGVIVKSAFTGACPPLPSALSLYRRWLVCHTPPLHRHRLPPPTPAPANPPAAESPTKEVGNTPRTPLIHRAVKMESRGDYVKGIEGRRRNDGTGLGVGRMIRHRHRATMIPRKVGITAAAVEHAPEERPVSGSSCA